MRSIFVAALIAGGWVAPAEALVTCTVTEKLRCSEGTGCAPIESTIGVSLDFSGGTYRRCDAKGCDDFAASFSKSGEFVIIDVPGRGMVAKLTLDGSGFVEVATVMSVVFVSFGSCSSGG